jgi:hypothetical protein
MAMSAVRMRGAVVMVGRVWKVSAVRVRREGKS